MTLPATLPVLTAVTGAWESALVSGLEQVGGEVVVVRRCVDLPDLIATAGTGQACAVVVSADLRRLDGAALAQLAAAGLAVVGLVDPGDEPAERRLRQLGLTEVLAADAPAAQVAEAVSRAVADVLARGPRAESGAAGLAAMAALADPASALRARPDVRAELASSAGSRGRPGRLVAVWGPTGAPGRTTVAVTLAAELARLAGSVGAAGQHLGPALDVLLADADTYGGSVAQVLGLLDEAPGLAAAARAADHGSLDLDQLARAAPYVLPHLRVLTGIVRPERWPELRPAALSQVFGLARGLAGWTVVDCGFSLERDEELSYDTAVPRRNGATLVTLAEADLVVAVGAADPVGLQRLVRALTDLADLRELRELTDLTDLADGSDRQEVADPGGPVSGGDPLVVVNRVRASAVGGSAETRVRDALARYAGVSDPILVPDDRVALDAALLAGRTLTEAAPTSPARLALARVAARLVESADPAAQVRQQRSVPRRGNRRARRG